MKIMKDKDEPVKKSGPGEGQRFTEKIRNLIPGFGDKHR
jgi:hypothetical protein